MRKRDPKEGTIWDSLLTSKKSRASWEAAFAKVYVTPIIEHLEDQVNTANQTLQSDTRFSSNPLMHVLHKSQPTSGVIEPEDMCMLHTFPDVWQYRPQVTIESLLQYLDRLHNVEDDNSDQTAFALLHEFLTKEHILSMLGHLPDLIRLQQVLIDQFHRRIDAAEAANMTIQEFLDKAVPGPDDVQQLVQIFIKVWNQLREYLPSYGGIVVPRDLCSQMLDTSHSIAMMLPTRRDSGVCSTALVDFLIGTHNEMVQFYQRIAKNTTRCAPIQPSDATLHHLVAYNKDKDLLPLVLSHRDYAVQAGQGTTHTFNLPVLQSQIEERFLRGRPDIIRKIEQLVFRQDSHDAVVFQTLRNRIPQKSLPRTVQHQILSQLRSLSDLSDCLAVLVIAIGFLVSSPCQPDMLIRKYLHTTLSLPPEKGIQASPKAHQYCRVHHILSLWQTLAVQQACRNKQDPFDDVGQEYRADLDTTQQDNIQQALRHINVEQLIAELYEYITLNLKRSDHEEHHNVSWRIIDALKAYMDTKYDNIDESPAEETYTADIHGLDKDFPKDLQLQHAVNTWKVVVNFFKQQQKLSDP
ncbi:E3 ubiquitin-protein ligase RNF213-like [Amphiura filiformis]|uniref:E3 ubiquitin-protein ligase RNF213-like n=1 Tax=Amphiura filiformis TaxID=82378 RepID=UPI003B217B8F